MVGLSATTIDNRIAGGLLAVAMLRQDLLTAHGCDMAGPGAVMRGDALRKAGHLNDERLQRAARRPLIT